jgi:hypothetical protein
MIIPMRSGGDVEFVVSGGKFVVSRKKLLYGNQKL